MKCTRHDEIDTSLAHEGPCTWPQNLMVVGSAASGSDIVREVVQHRALQREGGPGTSPKVYQSVRERAPAQSEGCEPTPASNRTDDADVVTVAPLASVSGGIVTLIDGRILQNIDVMYVEQRILLSAPSDRRFPTVFSPPDTCTTTLSQTLPTTPSSPFHSLGLHPTPPERRLSPTKQQTKFRVREFTIWTTDSCFTSRIRRWSF